MGLLVGWHRDSVGGVSSFTRRILRLDWNKLCEVKVGERISCFRSVYSGRHWPTPGREVGREGWLRDGVEFGSEGGVIFWSTGLLVYPMTGDLSDTTKGVGTERCTMNNTNLQGRRELGFWKWYWGEVIVEETLRKVLDGAVWGLFRLIGKEEGMSVIR